METLPHIIKTVFSFEEAKKYYEFLFRTSLELLMCSVTVLTGGLTKESLTSSLRLSDVKHFSTDLKLHYFDTV